MSMKKSIDKALCGGSEVYRALGEAQKALEVQEEQHRKEMEALRAENIRWRQIATEQDKQIDWLRAWFRATAITAPTITKRTVKALW